MNPNNRTIALTCLLAVLTVAGCGGASEAAGDEHVKLTLVAYSTPREAYEVIIPAFQKTAAGKGVTFETSYGASGEQSRAVVAGLAAAVVAFSLEPDVTRLVKEGLVDVGWNEDAFHGVVATSVVVLVVREGNPKRIHTWDDLIKPGVEVITPNPFTSGGARWNVMAAYGAQIKQGKTDQQAIAYLQALFANVPVQDKSAREALQTFVGGKGDVMIAYENEAITAQRHGEKLDYVIPDQTILIENPVAVVNSSEHVEQARAFVDFLRSPEAQQIFGEKGYRPILKESFDQFDFATPATLFTIADLGGWAEATKTFFDPANGVMATIEQERGAPVE